MGLPLFGQSPRKKLQSFTLLHGLLTHFVQRFEPRVSAFLIKNEKSISGWGLMGAWYGILKEISGRTLIRDRRVSTFNSQSFVETNTYRI